MTAVLEKPFDIATHNGIVTMRSLRTGEHRTFRIWTKSKESNFMPGRRVVGLLSGPDNESDYRAFGVMDDDGRIHLWRKHQGERFYQWAAAALSAPEQFLHQVEFSFDGRCRRCNRLLTDPDSVASGIGPHCAGQE